MAQQTEAMASAFLQLITKVLIHTLFLSLICIRNKLVQHLTPFSMFPFSLISDTVALLWHICELIMTWEIRSNLFYVQVCKHS